MENYTGYLKPYVPLIAAMLIVGQRPVQVARLLNAMKVSEPQWRWVDPVDEPLERPNSVRRLMAAVWEKHRRAAELERWNAGTAYRVGQMTGTISHLARTWVIKPKPYKRPTITAEWTPESNWHEAQAIRAEG